MSRFALAVLLVLFANAAVAQDTWQFWVKGQGQFYDNFFQAPEGTPQDDVRALFAEVGASVGLGHELRAYGQVNHLRYNEDALDPSSGIRLGLRMEGKPHAFDVYAEQLKDRPVFDVGDEFDRADIHTVAGEYSLRVVEDWQVSVDGELQEQDFEITPPRDNDFGALGAAVRWRGSRVFSPEIGVRVGERDVTDDTLSYDQRDLYLQIRSAPTPELYLSLRYRDRHRDYASFDREDQRRQIAAAADWRMSELLTWNAYIAREKVNSNLPDHDFDTGLVSLGVTLRF